MPGEESINLAPSRLKCINMCVSNLAKRVFISFHKPIFSKIISFLTRISAPKLCSTLSQFQKIPSSINKLQTGNILAYINLVQRQRK